MLKLLVCDDAPAARASLRAVLGGLDGVEVVGEAADGVEAVGLALALAPDVVLMDVAMPRVDGIEATRRIKSLLPQTRVVAFAGSDDTEVIRAMSDAGASAYCVKGAPLWELERALSEAAEPLVRLAQGLARAAGERGIAEVVARELAALPGVARADVFLVAEEGRLAHVAGGVASEATEAAARAAVRETALVRHGSELAAPLVADGELLGALVVAPADVADEDLVRGVADAAAASLAKERRLAASFAEARRDALTGLPNKRAFDERLEAAVHDVRVRGGELGVAIFDLDDFKQVNDRRGHPAGDRVLREVARAAERVLRPDEEVFRVGGEEFAVLVLGDADAAARVAERIRGALRGQRRGEPLPTISAGVASFPTDARTPAELVQAADVALYEAKRGGKDRTVVSGRVRPPVPARGRAALRVLLVDDDPGLRALVRTTLEAVDMAVDEAQDAAAADRRIAAARPDVVVLDVGMPGIDGLAYCRRLKRQERTAGLGVVLLTGDDSGTSAAAREAGADAFLRKPFSPLELLALVERVGAGGPRVALPPFAPVAGGEQLIAYARDLRRLLDVERGQRELLQRAYRETVTALVTALESKDRGTGRHSQRVQHYAVALARAAAPRLLDDPSVEFGFLLHDVGKIGIPDEILLKPGDLDDHEWRRMETHTVLGEQMLRGVALVQGEGLRVVRSHHERWDGGGYPDRLAGDEIPLAARVFAIADGLDAITSDRPYRAARAWKDAVAEIVAGAGSSYDPGLVEAFADTAPTLREIREG